jgi:hypothetical protein
MPFATPRLRWRGLPGPHEYERAQIARERQEAREAAQAAREALRAVEATFARSVEDKRDRS